MGRQVRFGTDPHRTRKLRPLQPVVGGVCCDSLGPKLNVSRLNSTRRTRTERSVLLKLDRFAWEIIDEEASREGRSTEELVAFSVLYYLADVDSGRIARGLAGRSRPSTSGDLSGVPPNRSSAPLPRRATEVTDPR
jgi:hypothetical protein